MQNNAHLCAFCDICLFLGVFFEVFELKIFNILYFEINEHIERSDKLKKQTKDKNKYPFEINLEGIYFLETSPNRFRLVTHHDFKKNEIDTVVSTISNILKG